MHTHTYTHTHRHTKTYLCRHTLTVHRCTRTKTVQVKPWLPWPNSGDEDNIEEREVRSHMMFILKQYFRIIVAQSAPHVMVVEGGRRRVSYHHSSQVDFWGGKRRSLTLSDSLNPRYRPRTKQIFVEVKL